MAAARENLPPQVIQRVARELRRLVVAPLDGIRYLPQDEEQLSELHVELRGPETTPYEGGFFRIKLVLSDGFPQAPPRGLFLTKIFHPNIATSGDICVNTLKKDWSPALGIAHVLQVIRCLLIVPFPESSLNDEAGRLFMDSYDEYARRARLWTAIHAPKHSAATPTPEDEQPRQDGDTSGGGGAAKTLDDERDAATAAGGNEVKDGAATPATPVKPTAASATDAADTTGATATPTTKKRTSSNAADVAASLKKKSVKKKGIKRL
ncbi:hypothetical protein PybrP1_005694 [[Pythium] brassicae (nom. inval.)]|nr:hypothetical protein PybrP1_005694 [[Pythium] brassicae (nom. inval.)]